MSAPAAPSSDRVRLRELARRVRAAEPAPSKRAAVAPAYVRLRAPVAAAPVVAMAAPVVQPAPVDVRGSAGWARLLAWCVDGVGARAAILTDDRGLVIASAGALELEVAQGIAARLVIAFHQADRMGAAPSPAMAIQLDDGWLTGVRIDQGGEPLTLGALGPRPLDEGARLAVAAALTAKAQAG